MSSVFVQLSAFFPLLPICRIELLRYTIIYYATSMLQWEQHRLELADVTQLRLAARHSSTRHALAVVFLQYRPCDQSQLAQMPPRFARAILAVPVADLRRLSRMTHFVAALQYESKTQNGRYASGHILLDRSVPHLNSGLSSFQLLQEDWSSSPQ